MWNFIIPAAAALIGGKMSSNAAKSAADTTAAASNRAADLQYQMFQEQKALQEPWRQAGVNALGKLQGASEYTPFGMQQFQQDPGYGFRMSEGLKALERTAAHRGGLLSGATLKGVQRFGQDLASDEYTNAFNRYQTERQAKLGPLQSLAGVGQTAANTLGSQAGAYGTNVGNLYTQQGDTAANALLAGTQARSSAYGAVGKALGGYLNTEPDYSAFAPQTYYGAR